MKINFSNQKLVMRRAHAIAKTLQGHYHARMSYSLKQAHLEYKLGMLKSNSLSNIEVIKMVLETTPMQRTNRNKPIGYFLSEVNKMVMVAERNNIKYLKTLS